VTRLSSWALPIGLAVTGVVLIIVGSLWTRTDPAPSLPPIATATPVAQASPTATPASAAPSAASMAPTPTPSPLPDAVVAEQLEIADVGINVLVRQSTDAATDSFPPSDAAFILSSGHQPGRNNNSYIFAHAELSLFKPLWNVQIGAEVLVRMSDGTVLRYVVTEVRPNVPCPDPDADPAANPPNPPLALQIHETCDEGAMWTWDTPYERLTLQTSQGFNRNWGELVVIARPTW
jgi:hypothetical protein